MVMAAILASCSSGAAPSPTTTGVIVIASDLPLHGIWQNTGLSMTGGIQFAVEHRPTIGKFRLVARPFDDTLAGMVDTTRAIQNVKLMAADSAVMGMVGPFNSFVAQMEIPAASQYELAIVSPSTTADCLTVSRPGCQLPARPGGINNFFRIVAPDRDQATAMADFAVSRLGVTSIAVLSDGAAYGEALADGFARRLPAAGGRVILREQVQSSTNNYSDLLQRIKTLGGQAIYMGGAPNLGVCRVRAQMPAILPDAYFLGGDALLDKSCVDDAQSGATNRMIATIPQGTPSTDKQAQKVVDDYRKTGRPATPYTFSAYDCTEILIDAIQRAMDANGGKLPSRSQVIQALTTTHLKGVTGNWSFDDHGDATAPAISFYRAGTGVWTFWQSVTVGPPTD